MSKAFKLWIQQRATVRHVAFMVIWLVVCSCGITKKYQSPELPDGNLYRGNASPEDTLTLALLPWEELFPDTLLQQLIRTGIENNLNLQIAYARINQVEASLRQSKAALLPAVNAEVSASDARLSEAQGFGIRTRATQYQVAARLNWEVDVWGALRSNRRASVANLLRSQAAARTVQSQMVSLIASYYYQLLSLDAQLIITEQTVHYWDTTVQTMRALKDAAVVTGAAVVQSEAQRFGAAVTIPDIRQRIREIENALSVLLGATPHAIQRGTLQQQSIPEELHLGVPFQLLAYRPDVQEAELNFRNAFELTNAARARFYPSLVISGSGGYTSLSFNAIFHPASLAGSIAASLTQPIFNQRTIRSRYEIAQAQQREAFLTFNAVVLQAGEEVSNALSLYERANEKIDIRIQQISALEKSVDFSNELLRNGFANYVEVIQARQSLLQAELGSANDYLQRLQAIVELYRSLGGGWQ